MIGLTRVKVPPYGNCLFEALICAMQQHLFIDSNGVVNKDKEGELKSCGMLLRSDVLVICAFNLMLIQKGDLRCYENLETNSTSRSEEHTSELQSLMRISYAVFCLKKKTTHEY